MISVAKTNLNNELNSFINLENKVIKNDLYVNIIKAKNQKIDELIKKYNKGIFSNKLKLENNKITLKNITQINSISLEIDNFNLDFPISFILKVITYDGEIINYNIIPFSHNGLFKEYFELDKKQTSYFKVTNKDNIYFYSCRYDEKKFLLGNEIKLKPNEDYYFENDTLVFDDGLKHKEILAMYLPNKNSYEIKINKKVRFLEIIPVNDKKGLDKKFEKRLVIK